MGTTLTGTTPQDTYDSLIKVTDNGPLSGTAKYLSDGLGNDSILALSTTAVGVGTASPSVPLEVNVGLNSLKISGRNTYVDSSGDSTNANIYISQTGVGDFAQEAGHLVLQARTQGTVYRDIIFAGGLTNGDALMTILGEGNVGIGTSSPATKLEIAQNLDNTDGPTLRIANNANTLSNNQLIGGIDFYNGDDSGGGDAVGAFIRSIMSDGSLPVNSQYLSFAAGGTTQRIRIDSDGLKFGSDTAAANALDDYEEGTFTPTAFGVTTAGTTTYSGQNGYYTKIGRQVTVSLYLAYSSMTGTGTMKIGGLPFAIANLTENYPVGSCIASAVNWTGGTYLQANGIINESNMYIVYVSDDASANVQDCVDESANYRITLTYFTA